MDNSIIQNSLYPFDVPTKQFFFDLTGKSNLEIARPLIAREMFFKTLFQAAHQTS